MLGQPLSHAPPPGGRLPPDRRAAGRHHRHRPGAHHHPAAAPARRGGQVRGVLRSRRGRGPAGQPGHHRQHVARVRGHLRHLPHRRGDPRLPALHRTGRPPRGPGRGLRQGAGHVPRPPAAPSRSSPRSSSSTSRPWCRASPGRPGPRTGCRSPTAATAFRDGPRPRAGGATAAVAPTGRRRRDRATATSWSPPSPAAPTPPTPRSWWRPACWPATPWSAGCTSKPWVKTTLAPGSRVVMDYLDRAGLTEPLADARLRPRRLRVHHLHRQLRAPAARGVRGGAGRRPVGGLGAVGQPELRGPDPPRRPHELPGLAAAGGGLRPGRDHGHRPHHRARSAPTATATRCCWPTCGRAPEEVTEAIRTSLTSEMFRQRYGSVFEGDERWRAVETATGDTFAWDTSSTYVLRPTFLEGLTMTPDPGHRRRRRPGPGQAGRQRDHRPHLPGRQHQADDPGRPVPGRPRRRARPTSTPTGPGGATTR